MSEDPAHRSYWQVGHTGEPLQFVPLEICEYSHRFDDLRHRFRTIYIAELAEACLRETLADFRPKLSTIRFFQHEMGAAAATDLPAWPITAAWRREHVLAPLRLTLDAPICDLTDIAQRRSIENATQSSSSNTIWNTSTCTRSRRLGVPSRRRFAADLYDDGLAAIRFPSHLDGNPCIAVFEGRGALNLDGANRVAHHSSYSTSPPPGTSPWRLRRPSPRNLPDDD